MVINTRTMNIIMNMYTNLNTNIYIIMSIYMFKNTNIFPTCIQKSEVNGVNPQGKLPCKVGHQPVGTDGPGAVDD